MNITLIGQGNAGAINCAINLASHGIPNILAQRLITLGITGSKFYTLVNNICNNNYDLVIYLLMHSGDAQLQLATERQSNYGIALLENEINMYFQYRFDNVA